MFNLLVEGLGMSMAIFALTIVGAIPLGIPVALARLSKFKPLALLVQFYISVMRGTPLMLQMFAVYFMPYYVFNIQTGSGFKFTACIIAFILNYAAYFAEIYRSGIQSIPQGQYEAAEVLGYSKCQAFFHIILPQVIKRILPSVTNEVITLVKDTSMAFVLAYAEMFTLAKQIAAAKTTFAPLFVAGVFYFVFNAVVAYVMEFFEKKMSYYR